MTTTKTRALLFVILALYNQDVQSFSFGIRRVFRFRTAPSNNNNRQLLEERLTSFSQRSPPKNTAPDRLPSFSVDMDHSGEASEWYVPPPPPSRTPPLRLSKRAIPHVQAVESHADLLEFLAEDDRICVVKFYGNWCKSCQKFGIHFDKLAAEKGDWVNPKTGEILKRNQIRIASIEHSQCKALCKSLGITKLPTIFFYKDAKKVSEICVGASKFRQVRAELDRLSNTSPGELEFAAQMEAGSALIKSTMESAAAVVADSSSSAVASNSAGGASDALQISAAAAGKVSIPDPAPRRRWWVRNE